MNRIQMPIFELENVRVERNGRTTLKIAKFKFHRGTIYGIVGPVGAGKTTLLEVLSGRLVPTEGTLLYESENFAKTWWGKTKPPPDIIFPNKGLTGYRGSVGEYIRAKLPERQEWIRSQFYSGPRDSAVWDIPIQNLSRGESHQVNMIVAIESDPKVLLIDDYGISFDVQMKRDFDRRLKYSSRSRGATVLLTSTDVVAVKDLASVLLFLDNGHIARVRSQKRS